MKHAAPDHDILSVRLKRRVRIEQPSRLPDGQGGYAVSWQLVDTVWAAIRAVSSGEPVVAGQPSARVTHRIVMRWRADVTPAMRLAWGTRVFNIRAAINQNEAGHILEILAEEGAAL